MQGNTGNMPEPVYVVDAEGNPLGLIQPCPAQVAGPFLGSDATVVRCSGTLGHEGRHYHHIEWIERGELNTNEGVVDRTGPPWRCPVCDYRDQYGERPFMCHGPHGHRHAPRAVIPADDQEASDAG